MKKLLLALLILPFTIQAQIITTVAGNGYYGCATSSCGTCYSGDGGLAVSSELNGPVGVAVDGNGNIYIVDAGNQRIRKVNTAGIITTFAGTGTYGYTGDGGLATAAEVQYPQDVAVDGNGNVYIADIGGSRIRKVNTSGVINTIISFGTGEIWSIAIDKLGNLFAACENYNYVAKVDTAGVITTIAGSSLSGGYSGDGGLATAAELNQPTGVAIDNFGNIFIADRGNNRIRKVDTTGIITTIAGNGTYGYTGDGGLATAANLLSPTRVAIDSAGNIFITEPPNGSVRKVNTSGYISTIAGLGSCVGSAGYCGDGLPSTDANLCKPWGITFDSLDNYYIADMGDNVIRKVSSTVLSIIGTANVCVGSMITLTDSTIGGIWSSSNTTVATIGSYSGIVAGVSAGTTIISYGGTATSIVTINPLASAGTISGVTSICVGSTITLSDATSGGVWSSSNTMDTIIGGSVAGVVVGTDTIKYSITTTCGTDTASKIITVIPLPVAGTITGADTVCIGDTISLIDAVIGGSWITSNGNAFVSSVGIVRGITVGTDIITYTVSNTCGTALVDTLINVIDCTSGIENISSQSVSFITIFPNPNKGLFTVNISTPDNEDAQIIITNILGEKVKELTILTNKETDVQLQTPAGIYFISAVTKNESVTEKIIIE